MPNASLIGVLRGVGKFTLKHSSVVYRAYWRNKCALRFIFARVRGWTRLRNHYHPPS